MQLPLERKLWILRKYVYGGLPPTDPRILAMTPEQVELEFAHMAFDKKANSPTAEEYNDDEFEQWNREIDEIDSKLSYDYKPRQALQPDPNDWEDIEP